MQQHIVLLGDSILDNGSYVPGEPSVSEQLQRQLPHGWQVTLLAVDGDVTADVPGQLEGVPADASCLIVSVGGNDALRQFNILEQPVDNVGNALVELSRLRQRFAQDYRHMLRAVLEKDSFYFAPNFNATLASHFSKFRFEKPFYYGRFHDMILAYFFDTDQVIRFSQSPTGGGPDNPAWDFQFLIPNFVINQVYSFRARIIYKPFISAEEIVSEYEKWMNEQH